MLRNQDQVKKKIMPMMTAYPLNSSNSRTRSRSTGLFMETPLVEERRITQSASY
jgi:hypothetical protein